MKLSDIINEQFPSFDNPYDQEEKNLMYQLALDILEDEYGEQLQNLSTKDFEELAAHPLIQKEVKLIFLFIT